MENWGLVTYRETALLYNPTEDSESSKQRVAVIIAHELAHQVKGGSEGGREEGVREREREGGRERASE